MLHVDIPTRSEFASLSGTRADACVSIYLRTTPITQDTDASRIELGNLIREAQHQLEAAGLNKRRLAPLMDELGDLVDDDEFWMFQANSLAIFATPDQIRTYRLANELVSTVQVSDRFHLKPLFRAVTFPHSAFILAFSENAVRLIETHADLPPVEVKVPGMPKSAADSVGKSTLNKRNYSRRLHASEGQNIRFQQYARKVDAALRPILAGRETPLILAATGRLADVFLQLNSYPHLLPDTISESPDRLSAGELAEKARPVLDAAYEQEIREIRELFEQRTSDGRTVTDVSDAARAATFGAVETLLVDIDSVVPGFVDDETGAVTFSESEDATSYGVVAEIAARALSSGAQVLGVRRDEIPGKGDLAAILRYTL